MVERFNGRIKEVVQQTRFESAQQLEETLIGYLQIYNSNIPQRNLGHVTPMEALSKWRRTHPDLFKKSESNHPGLDRKDTDGDGIGDNADSDDDNDGVSDNADNCPSHANPRQEDGDDDGLGDACDPLSGAGKTLPSAVLQLLLDR